MLDIALLEMTQTDDAACQNRPQFLLLEPPLLKASLVDLVLQGALGEKEEGEKFEVGHAELIL